MSGEHHTHEDFDRLTIGCPACIDRRGPRRSGGAPREKEPPPPVREVRLGDRWRLFSPGVAHIYDVHRVGRGELAFTANTLCDKAKVPLTGEPGTIAGACQECWRRGATIAEREAAKA